MAIAAMSYVTHLEREEVFTLLNKFKNEPNYFSDSSTTQGLSSSSNQTMILRKKFTALLKDVGINQNDADILDRIFTMYDDNDEDMICFKDFLVGISPLVCDQTGTPLEVLKFAFHLYDDENTSRLLVTDMINVILQINRVASFFGDPVLTEEQVAMVIRNSLNLNEATFTSLIAYDDYLRAISDHPLVDTFLSGNGVVQYGAVR